VIKLPLEFVLQNISSKYSNLSHTILKLDFVPGRVSSKFVICHGSAAKQRFGMAKDLRCEKETSTVLSQNSKNVPQSS
jgi:hypothetical protein